MRALQVLTVLSMLAAPVLVQAQTPSSPPAAMESMLIPSHGEQLLGVFYLAAGAGPHPTVVLLHGFPGFEQNLDLAQALRAHGWNVLAMHYRGSWGVKGNFSFEHCAEDATTEVHFVLDPQNVQKYRIDPHHVVVIGHSMGGYMAAHAAAHNPQVAAAVLISAWNIGADADLRGAVRGTPFTVADEAKALAEDDDLVPLAGTSGDALAREIFQNKAVLNFNNLAPSIAPRPVFVITANDHLASVDHALAEALRRAGDAKVTERHWDTDHSYSGERAALTTAVLEWLQSNVAH